MQGSELPLLSNWQNFYMIIGTAAAMALLLFLGIHNAWDLVTYLAIERALSENKSTEQKQATRRK